MLAQPSAAKVFNANERSNAADSISSAEASTARSQSIIEKLVDARANLAAQVAFADAAMTNAPAGISLQDIATRRAMLQRLVRLYEQELSNTAELESTKRRRADLQREAQAWTRFAEPAPYSILLADRLREEVQGERLALATNEAAQRSTAQLIEENRTLLTQSEEKTRQITEQLETAMDTSAAARLAWQRDLERVRSQIAVASMGLLDSENQLREEVMAEGRIRLGWLERQLALAAAGARFTQADLDSVLARIEGDTQQLERELALAQTRSTMALQAVDAAREESSRIQAQGATGPARLASAAEQLATRETQLEVARAGVRTLRFMLEAENAERTMWQLRFAAENSGSLQMLRESRNRLKSFSRRLELWNDYEKQQFELSSAQIGLQEARLSKLPPDSEVLPVVRERMAALRERDQLLLRLVRRLGEAQRLGRRWEEGLRSAEGRLPFLSRLGNVFSDARSLGTRLWNFELFAAEDTIMRSHPRRWHCRHAVCFSVRTTHHYPAVKP